MEHTFSYAHVRKPEHEGMNLPESYQSYVIKMDHQPVGLMTYAYRPKNAGGHAYKITLPGFGACQSTVVLHNQKDKRKALEEAKNSILSCLKTDHMGFHLMERVVYRDEDMFMIIGFAPVREIVFLGREMGGEVLVEAHYTDLN